MMAVVAAEATARVVVAAVVATARVAVAEVVTAVAVATSATRHRVALGSQAQGLQPLRFPPLSCYHGKTALGIPQTNRYLPPP